MAKRPVLPFLPDYTVLPGDTLGESLEATGMTQGQLADRTGLSRKTINGIINGRESISSETALSLEKVFRVPAAFWTNLQKSYDETVARLAENKRLADQVGWLSERRLPLKELCERNAIPTTNHKVDQLREVLKFFGVADSQGFEKVWASIERTCSTEVPRHRFGALAAWLRLGELAAFEVPCNPFSKDLLEAFLKTPGFLTSSRVRFEKDKLASDLARHGIALVFVPCFKGAEVVSATRWITPAKALVEIGVRSMEANMLRPVLLRALAIVAMQERGQIILDMPAMRVSSNGSAGVLRRLPLKRSVVSRPSSKRAMSA